MQPLSEPHATKAALTKPGKLGGVLSSLGHAIAGGELAPGALLPNERDLELRYGASRSVVREAVKILATKGLVSVGPRLGTRVRPRKDWSLLDGDVLGWISRGGLSREMLLTLDEARRVVEPGAAEIAALRADDQDRAQIRKAYLAMEAACHDFRAATEADKRFHLAILEATHNPVLRSFRTAIEATLDAVFSATIPMLAPNLPNHEAVAAAIEAGDPAASRAAMERLLGRTRDLIQNTGHVP